jgi:hypothetical protein
MSDMLLRGYVTPEDFEGTDTERLQKAFDASHELDVGRVVLKGSYTVEKTILIYGMTDLVLDDAAISATGDFPVLANVNFTEEDKHSWSFQDRFITIRGNGSFEGDVLIYNAFHVNIDGIKFVGALRFAFTSEVRLYNSTFVGESGVVLSMGNNNFIMQNLTADCKNSAIVMDATLDLYDYVIGKEPEIHEIILQDSTFNTSAPAVSLVASSDAKVYNMQIDHLASSGVTLAIGKEGECVPEDCYFNLTGEHFTSGAKDAIVINNPVKHCYFPK